MQQVQDGTVHEGCFVEEKEKAPEGSGEPAAASVWSWGVHAGRSCKCGASEPLVTAWHRLYKARRGRSSLPLHAVCPKGVTRHQPAGKGHPMQGHSPEHVATV